jgi:adenylate cyclase
MLAFQDEVAARIVAAIQAHLPRGEVRRAGQRSPATLHADDLVLRGRSALGRWTREGFDGASRLFRQAVEIDPDHALARALLARSRFMGASRMLYCPSESEMDGHVRTAWGATELAAEDPDVLVAAAHVIGIVENPDEGLALLDRALSLNPNAAEAWAISGLIHAYDGDTATAIRSLEQSARLSCPDHRIPNQAFGFVVAHTIAGRYADALRWIEKSGRDVPNNFLNIRTRAALLGLVGRTDEARLALRQLFALVPGVTVSRLRHHNEVVMRSPFRFRKAGFNALVREGLRRAGLPG